MKEITMYECGYCQEEHRRKEDAMCCEFRDIRRKYANMLLELGYELDHIEYCCHFGWSLREELKKVNKDSCFIISWWQCCDKPAYRILEINKDGSLVVGGKGSWSGMYSSAIQVEKLGTPYPKEDLYVC